MLLFKTPAASQTTFCHWVIILHMGSVMVAKITKTRKLSAYFWFLPQEFFFYRESEDPRKNWKICSVTYLDLYFFIFVKIFQICLVTPVPLIQFNICGMHMTVQNFLFSARHHMLNIHQICIMIKFSLYWLHRIVFRLNDTKCTVISQIIALQSVRYRFSDVPFSSCFTMQSTVIVS